MEIILYAVVFITPIFLIFGYILGLIFWSQSKKELPLILKNSTTAAYAIIIYILSMVFTVISAAHLAPFCGLQEEVITQESSYYLHRKSVYFPRCANVGVLLHGETPNGYVALKLLPPAAQTSISGEQNLIITQTLLMWLAFITIVPSLSYAIGVVKLKEKRL